MAGPRCPMMHWFSHKARVNIKNGRLKAIKAALSLSRRLVHDMMFEVHFYFQSLTIYIYINPCSLDGIR
jgi:hypothetical protein